MSLSLTDLLAAAQSKVKATEAKAKAEIKVKKARSAGEREEAQEEVNTLREQLDWETRALVYRVTRWQCACGGEGRTPIGMFLYQEHTRMANTTRMQTVRNEASVPGLARHIVEETSITFMCPECLPNHGFFTPLPKQSLRQERAVALRQPGLYVADWHAKRSPTYSSKEQECSPLPSDGVSASSSPSSAS